MQEKSFKDTVTTKWIGKHFPVSVSISSNHVEEPFSLYNSNPHHLSTSSISAFENLVLQSQTIMKKLFFDINTTKKIKLGSILEKLFQCHNREEQPDLDDCDNETCIFTQFLRIQKKQLVDLQDNLEQYCNDIPVFGFNSAKYDFNLIVDQRAFCYPFSLTGVTLNLILSKERTCLSRANSVIFSCRIF